MRDLKTILTIAVIFSVSVPVFALDSQWAQNQKKRMDKIIQKSGISPEQLSIYVAGGEGEPTLVTSIQGEKKMIPASITKIVTAATALKTFPPGTKFKTSLLSSGGIHDGVLKGDLYLRGGGDPSFVSENMWYLVNAFNRNEINKIEGNIVVDDSLFDNVRIDSTRQKERVDRAYDAPTGAMSFNWNSVNVFVRPGKAVGSPAQVFIDPENEYIRLVGHVETVSSGGKTNVMVDRDEDSKTNVGDVIKVSGKIALGSKEIVIYKNITQPDLWAGYNLKSFLSQRKISISGTVKTGITPSSAKILSEVDNKTIESILADMNKFSNNYIAEMLTKNIGAVNSAPGTLAKGMKGLNEYMKSLKVPPEQYELFNPSGLTRENKMSAFALWKVLNDIKFQFQFQPEFATSLPIAGIDGTLKNRMKNTSAERWVRAKTGFLTGVVALAGYAGRRDGTVLPFVYIYNGSADEGKVRNLFDQLSVSLVEDDK
jgi:D-alanyl-D-alanine carboxypeptidase/D-alanyl-D-alanine-endopeptidase (penicillin-binding protein 4)